MLRVTEKNKSVQPGETQVVPVTKEPQPAAGPGILYVSAKTLMDAHARRFAEQPRPSPSGLTGAWPLQMRDGAMSLDVDAVLARIEKSMDVDAVRERYITCATQAIARLSPDAANDAWLLGDLTRLLELLEARRLPSVRSPGLPVYMLESRVDGAWPAKVPVMPSSTSTQVTLTQEAATEKVREALASGHVSCMHHLAWWVAHAANPLTSDAARAMALEKAAALAMAMAMTIREGL